MAKPIKDIQTIKERVHSLLMKAADAAASPSEAEGAMRLAQKLMAEYQISKDDMMRVSTDDYRFARREGKRVKDEVIVHPVERYCAVIVGQFCGVIPYIEDKTTLVLFGLDADVALAEWMLAAFKEQFEHDWLLFKRFQMQSKRLLDLKEARKSFIHGFTKAVRERLEKWLYRKTTAGQSPERGTGDGTDIAIVKQDSARSELSHRGINLGHSSGRRGDAGSDSFAAGAGYNAGKSASVGGQATGQSAGPIMIGR